MHVAQRTSVGSETNLCCATPRGGEGRRLTSAALSPNLHLPELAAGEVVHTVPGWRPRNTADLGFLEQLRHLPGPQLEEVERLGCTGPNGGKNDPLTVGRPRTEGEPVEITPLASLAPLSFDKVSDRDWTGVGPVRDAAAVG